jgi:hypothetical protein
MKQRCIYVRKGFADADKRSIFMCNTRKNGQAVNLNSLRSVDK